MSVKVDPPDLSPFPLAPNKIEYVRKPILSYTGSNDTYVVTGDFVSNSVKNELFTRAVIKWQRENNVE